VTRRSEPAVTHALAGFSTFSASDAAKMHAGAVTQKKACKGMLDLSIDTDSIFY